jgi:hypothetical protein
MDTQEREYLKYKREKELAQNKDMAERIRLTRETEMVERHRRQARDPLEEQYAAFENREAKRWNAEKEWLAQHRDEMSQQERKRKEVLHSVNQVGRADNRQVLSSSSDRLREDYRELARPHVSDRRSTDYRVDYPESPEDWHQNWTKNTDDQYSWKAHGWVGDGGWQDNSRWEERGWKDQRTWPDHGKSAWQAYQAQGPSGTFQ